MHWHCVTMVIVALGLREVACRKFTREEGAFEAVVHNVTTCVVEQPWFHAVVTPYASNGRSLLRGRFVTQRTMKNVKFNIQLYFLEKGRFMVFNMKNQNCHNILVRVVLQALKVPYNTQKCTLEPSTTEFSNLDIDAVIHTVTQSLWYGSGVVRWEIVMASPAARIMCIDINMDIVKADKNGVKSPQ